MALSQGAVSHQIALLEHWYRQGRRAFEREKIKKEIQRYEELNEQHIVCPMAQVSYNIK